MGIFAPSHRTQILVQIPAQTCLIDVKYQPKTFECTQCGECCTGFHANFGALVFGFEVPKLARHLALAPEVFLARYCVPVKFQIDGKKYDLYRLRYKHGECTFLSSDKRCSIHPHKPEQCKRGPYGFFWQRPRRSDLYECMRNVVVPYGWTSSRWDAGFLKRFVPIMPL